MTTQPPDTKVQNETLGQTAERIVLEVAANPESCHIPTPEIASCGLGLFSLLCVMNEKEQLGLSTIIRRSTNARITVGPRSKPPSGKDGDKDVAR